MADEDKKKDNSKEWAIKLILLAILIIVCVYLFVWTGNIRCSKIPGMCGLYWGVQTIINGKTQPSVAIVYDPADKDGLGNPELLQNLLSDRTTVGIHANLININYLSPDQLNKVSLVIVEKTRKMSALNMITFMDYVATGGRLIWVGDAGIELKEGEKYVTMSDRNPDLNNNNTEIKWGRLTSENEMINFDKFLGVSYEDNYCNIKTCSPTVSNGKLIAETENRFTYSLKPNLLTYDDFSIVKVIDFPKVTPLKLDFGSNLFDNNMKNYGSTFPLIVISNSNKVAYYAMPIEYLNEDSDKQKYLSLIVNMIDGMLN
ncbi:MAG: hypothetical protein V1824_01005 [archaeon]